MRLTHVPAAVRLRAAECVFDQAIKGIGLEDIEARVSELARLQSGMDCEEIEGYMLDEIVLGVATDLEVLRHVAGCASCIRLLAHREWVEGLRAALSPFELH